MENQIKNIIITHYNFAAERSGKPGWDSVTAARKANFYESIPAVAALLTNYNINLGKVCYDETLNDYFITCVANKEKVGYVVLKTDHLELRYTTNYNFSTGSCGVDTSVISDGNNIRGCITELVDDKTIVQTEFNEKGIFLDDTNIKPYISEYGVDKMREVIVAEQIKFYYAQQQKEEHRQL